MRTMGVAVMATALALAGCLGGDDGTDGDDGDGPGPVMGWLHDCSVSNWAEACNVHASPNPSPAKTEIDIVVNPTDPMNVFVASKDLDTSASECVWSVGQVSKDGGRTWTTVYVAGTSADRHPLLAPYTCITDPIMAFGADGVLYYPLQAYESRPEGPLGMAPDPLGITVNSGFYLAVSRDGGETFPEIIPMAIADGTVVFHDYPRMAVSPDSQAVHTVWNALGLGGVNPYVVTTRDGGRTVDPPAVVAFPDAPRTTAFASGFAAAPGGVLYMTVIKFTPAQLVSGGGDTVTVHLATSTDDGRSFSAFAPILDATPIECPLPNTEFRCSTSFELAHDGSGGAYDGRLYLVWDDGRNGDADVFTAWSDDAGATWSAPVMVSTGPNQQWMPRTTVAGDGSLHVLYMDRQHDPADRLIDATHAWSADGGATWSYKRLTTTSFDGDLGVHQDGFPFIGDYNGISAAGEHVWMGFPTTHTGVAEIGVAHAYHVAPPTG